MESRHCIANMKGGDKMAVGVIKVLSRKDRSYYCAADVQELLGVSRSKAYQIIKIVRDENIKAGRLNAAYPNGKIPKAIFDKEFVT